jgi:hypothetical protein
MDQTHAAPAAASADKPQNGSAAPHDERLELIRAFLTQALQRADPLAANLAVLNADLMQFAYRLRQSMEQSLTGSHPDYPELARQTELYLRCVRQVDRLAQLDRHLAQPARPGKRS